MKQESLEKTIIEHLEIMSKSVESLNYSQQFPSILAKTIDYFKNNKESYFDVITELESYKDTLEYYESRSGESLIRFFEAHGGPINDRLYNDLIPIVEKYGLDIEEIFGICLDNYLDNTPVSYIPKTRIHKRKLVAADDEIIDSIIENKIFILYPYALISLKKVSSKHYSQYLEIISYWIFLNISNLIQLHTGINKRNANEIAAIMVNEVADVKRSRSAYEKATQKHLHYKAFGTYFYEYYGWKYRNDLDLLRKIIAIKDKTIKKTSFKNLMNLIYVDEVLDDKIPWNIIRFKR